MLKNERAINPPGGGTMPTAILHHAIGVPGLRPNGINDIRLPRRARCDAERQCWTQFASPQHPGLPPTDGLGAPVIPARQTASSFCNLGHLFATKNAANNGPSRHRRKGGSAKILLDTRRISAHNRSQYPLARAGANAPPKTVAEIRNLSHRHEAILQFLVANPEMRLGDVARHFAVTQPWLSTLIHSDLFQRRLNEVQGALTDEITFGIKDKLTELAHQSLDRLLTRVQAGVVDTDDMLDIAEMAVKRTIGDVPRSGTPVIQQNLQQNLFLSADDLQQARQLMLQRAALPSPTLKEITDVNLEQALPAAADSRE